MEELTEACQKHRWRVIYRILYAYHLGVWTWGQRWGSDHTQQVWQSASAKYNNMQMMIIQSSTTTWAYLRRSWSRVMHFILTSSAWRSWRTVTSIQAWHTIHSELESGHQILERFEARTSRKTICTTTTGILVNLKTEKKAAFIGLRNVQLTIWYSQTKHNLNRDTRDRLDRIQSPHQVSVGSFTSLIWLLPKIFSSAQRPGRSPVKVPHVNW